MKIKLVFLLIICTIISCSEDSEFIPPSVVTLESQNITSGGVQLFGDFQSFNQENILGFFVYDNLGFSKDIIITEPVAGENSVSLTSGLYLDRPYFYKAYIKTGNEVFIGLEESFISNGSSLVRFDAITPNKGNYGDLVEIVVDTDSLLDNSNDIKVYFNGSESQITNVEGNKLTCIIPNFTDNYLANISVNYYGRSITTDLDFELLPPIINEITPQEVTYNEEITIVGDNFDTQNYELPKVFIDDFEAIVLTKSKTELKVKIPKDVINQNPKVKVESNLQETVQENRIKLKTPIITSYPVSSNINDEIKIEGENFNPDYIKNEVYFQNEKGFVYGGDANTLYVKVPSGPYSDWNPSISVKISENLISPSYPFTILDPSIAIKKGFHIDVYGFQLYDGVIQVFGFNSSNELITEKYNPERNEFYDKKSFNLPISDHTDIVNTQDGNIYMYFRRVSDNFFKMNLNTGELIQLADFPGVKRSQVVKAIGNGYISIGGGRDFLTQDTYDDVYKFSLQNNTWERIDDIPDLPVYLDFYAAKENQSYFLQGVYSVVRDIYEYSGNGFTLSSIVLPEGYRDALSRTYFFDNDKFYFIGDRSIRIFDTITKNWSEILDVIPDRYNTYGIFMKDNVIYIPATNYDQVFHLFKIDLERL